MIKIQFAFVRNYTKDREIKVHAHACHELVAYLDATCECLINEKEIINIRSNQVLLIPPNVSHGEKHVGYSKVLAIGFTTDEPDFNFEQVLLHSDMTVLNAVEAIRKELAKKQFAYLDVIKNYLSVLLYQFCRKQLPPTVERYSIDFALKYIDEYFHTELNVDELAAVAGYTSDYFRILFKERTGKTPKKYITDKRMSHAKKLLEFSTLSVTEIAYECGFNYVPQFLVFFKKNMGITPGQYRNKFKK